MGDSPKPTPDPLSLLDTPGHSEHHALSVRVTSVTHPPGSPPPSWLELNPVIQGNGWLIEHGLASDRSRDAGLVKPPPPPIPGSPLATIRHVAAPPPPRPKLIIENMDECDEEEYEWLWPGRIPLGTVSLLMGRMGDGKSTLTGWLAATVSGGHPWPDCPDENEPGTVLILQAEESRGKAIKPRLNAFNYGRGKVHTIKGVDRGDGRASWFSLGRDAEALADECARIGDVRLIMVDPLDSYTRGISGYNSTEVRELLQPVFDLAEAQNLAVLLVAHPNKDGEKDILDRVSGAGAYMQMVRMAWYLSEDPNDRGRRLLSLMKGNPDGATRTGIAVHYDNRRRKITWLPDPVAMSAREVDQHLQKLDREAKLTTKRGPDPALTRRGEEFLIGLLQAGPSLQSAAEDQALNLGIKGATFRRALKRLIDSDGRVRRERDKDDGRWWLKLGAPGDPPPAGPEAGREAAPETPPEGGG